MTAAVHLLGGNLDEVGGVADYTSVLAGALSSRGVTVQIWDAARADAWQRIHETLSTQPGPIIVQYVPNAFGWRGANVPFCLRLLRLRRAGHDVRVTFHEPYFYFGVHPLRNALAIVQRVMAAVLLRSATVTYVSTENWIRYLKPYAPAAATFVTLPIPATVEGRPDPERVREWRARLSSRSGRQLVAHFGTYGSHVASELSTVLSRLMPRAEDVAVVCLGQGSDAFARRFGASHPTWGHRVIGTGPLASSDVAAVLQACEVAVQPYPDGVTTRRTSVMAALCNGVPTVTSEGVLTEPLWRESMSVALAAACDPDAHVREILSLLHDDGRRADLGRRGSDVYQAQFSIDRTIDRVLGQSLAGTA